MDPPEPSENWWSAYRHLFETVASTGERHTSSPDRAWFGVWEGHRFANSRTRVAWQGSPDEATEQALQQQRSLLQTEDNRRNAAVQESLDQVPRFDLPQRSYHLLAGPVSAATQLNNPGSRVAGAWRHPDLFWPDDRRWFVITDRTRPQCAHAHRDCPARPAAGVGV